MSGKHTRNHLRVSRRGRTARKPLAFLLVLLLLPVGGATAQGVPDPTIPGWDGTIEIFTETPPNYNAGSKLNTTWVLDPEGLIAPPNVEGTSITWHQEATWTLDYKLDIGVDPCGIPQPPSRLIETATGTGTGLLEIQLVEQADGTALFSVRTLSNSGPVVGHADSWSIGGDPASCVETDYSFEIGPCQAQIEPRVSLAGELWDSQVGARFFSDTLAPCRSDFPAGIVLWTLSTDLELGAIFVEKQAIQDSLTGFDFEGDLQGVISDDQFIARTLAPGTYTTKELLEQSPGWSLESIECDHPLSFGDVSTATATYVVADARIVRCVFTNEPPSAQIIVEKQTVPDGSPDLFEFRGHVNAELSDGQQVAMNVSPGTYEAIEVETEGWAVQQITCDDTDSTGDPSTRTATFNVADGETVLCVFVNNYLIDCAANPELNPVECYAPEVRLHPAEEFFPMGVSDFVDNSALRFANKNCPDQTLAGVGEIDQIALGVGGYSAFQTRFPSCLPFLLTGAFGSDELTRPYTREAGEYTRARWLHLEAGFYLDLDDSARTGSEPIAGEPWDEVLAPIYYTYVPGDYVTYWFMYGYDNKAGRFPDRVVAHEGEWERLTVKLDTSNRASSFWYFQHTCDAEEYTPEQMTTLGYLTDGSHPIVYSALGAHASYPIVRPSGTNSCEKPLEGRSDVTANGGARWRTWENEVIDITQQHFYGFGGAWGSTASPLIPTAFLRDAATGPLGPPFKDAGSPTYGG